MLLTEEEAHQQECPVKTLMVNEEAALHHGQVPIYIHQSCAGRHCKMAWRWAPGTIFAVGMDGSRTVVGEARGYCGLAGRPE